MTDDNVYRGGLYPSPVEDPVVWVVDTEVRRVGGPSKDSRKRHSYQSKVKYFISVLELVGATPDLPKYANVDVDAEKFYVVWEGRISSRR